MGPEGVNGEIRTLGTGDQHRGHPPGHIVEWTWDVEYPNNQDPSGTFGCTWRQNGKGCRASLNSFSTSELPINPL